MNALRRHPLALQLAILAVLLRAVLPGGFMPVRAADGSGVAMVLCSADAARRAASQPHDDTARVLHGACAYAAAAAPALPPTLAHFHADTRIAAAPLFLGQQTASPTAERRRPPARAPPLQA